MKLHNIQNAEPDYKALNVIAALCIKQRFRRA